jgi:hypothetical protein
MADFTFGQLPNQTSDNVAVAVQALGSHQEYITIATFLNITPAVDTQTGNPTDDDNIVALSQGQLNKLIQIVSERGQPVIMGNVTSTGTPVVYTLFLVNEHYNAWSNTGVQGVVNVQLQDRLALDGINYGFGGAVVTGNVTSTTLTVTAVTSGSIGLGSVVTGAGIGGNTQVTAFLTGTGGVGTYTVSVSSSATGSITITAASGTATSDISGPNVSAVTFASVLT